MHARHRIPGGAGIWDAASLPRRGRSSGPRAGRGLQSARGSHHFTWGGGLGWHSHKTRADVEAVGNGNHQHHCLSVGHGQSAAQRHPLVSVPHTSQAFSPSTTRLGGAAATERHLGRGRMPKSRCVGISRDASSPRIKSGNLWGGGDDGGDDVGRAVSQPGVCVPAE